MPYRRFLPLLLLAACGVDDTQSDPDTSDATSVDAGVDVVVPSDVFDVAAPDAAGVEAAACVYTNPFGGAPECKVYVGDGWPAAAAAEDCGSVASSTDTSFAPEGCSIEAPLGYCDVDADTPEAHRLVLSGDETDCNISRLACENFAAGTFTPTETCEGNGPVAPIGSGDPFTQPYLSCEPPFDGEPAGDGPEGDVCTRVLISGCTEEGRRFDDYGSCEAVITQRPYYGFEIPADTEPDDPRLEDDEYLEELDWVTEQVEACACVCCHDGDIAPDGASGWDIRADGLWIDTVPDNGLAMLGGLVNSEAFGAYLAEDNNGFDRFDTGLPTTNTERMQTFLVEEYLRRGNTLEDAEQVVPFGGPLYTQLIYEAEACDPGVGFDESGAIQWNDGDARYLYVLAVGSENPGVPPNLDLPEGTLWQVFVDEDTEPFATGVVYGEVPAGAQQRAPDAEPAPALASGDQVYLYVLADIAVPLARCITTVP